MVLMWYLYAEQDVAVALLMRTVIDVGPQSREHGSSLSRFRERKYMLRLDGQDN